MNLVLNFGNIVLIVVCVNLGFVFIFGKFEIINELFGFFVLYMFVNKIINVVVE